MRNEWLISLFCPHFINKRLFSLGALLLKAAEMLQDEAMLLKVRDCDLVATETKYHRSCYRRYTCIAYKGSKHSCVGEQNNTTCDLAVHDETFKLFCKTVIEERIIQNGETIQMNKLREML